QPLSTRKGIGPEKSDGLVLGIELSEPPIDDCEHAVQTVKDLGPVMVAPTAVPSRPDREMKTAIGIELGVLEEKLDPVVRELAKPMMVGIAAIAAALNTRHGFDHATRRLDIAALGNPHH